MIPFRYARISQNFIDDLNEITQSGESAVLLGPRYVGKRYVIHHLRRLWAAQSVSPVVALQFMSEASICTTAQLREIISMAVAEVAPELVLPGRRQQDPLAPIRLLAERTRRPVYMTAANIDGMAHHLARSFLQGVRKLVEGEEGKGGDAKIVAVMSGEDVFHELVYGPNSEFNCAYQYVLQGFTREEFNDCLRRYLSNMRLIFAEEQEAVACLFERSGGNTYILRIILWSILQARTRQNVNAETPVTLEEIPDSFKMMNVPGAYGSHIFRRATQIVEREPECWGDLEALLKSESIPLPAGHNAPGRLELAGIATSTSAPGAKRQRIEVSSPLMRAFLEQYYNPRRLGDLYASIGEWESAFERYMLLKTDEERKRPSGADDREDVETTIGALSASLFRHAKKTNDDHTGLAEGIKRLFVRGCNYVLGFSEVTFWHRATWQRNPEWRLEAFDGYKPEKAVLQRLLKVLPSSIALQPGRLTLQEPENKFAAAALLPAQRMDEQIAVIVSDFGQEVVISRERERLMKKLFEHFVEAYTHAVKVDELNARMRARDEHVRIMNSIFRSLGEHDLSVDNMLNLAADGLLRLHHRRVIFSLVDPERHYIEVVLDRCTDRAGNMEGRKWSLKTPMADMHPYVVNTKEPLIIPDAVHHPLPDKGFVRATRLKALAIMPLLNQAGDAAGAILIERDNGALSSDKEIEDLKPFCNQLAIAIEQCERINMLESGINKMPEPLIIVDGTASPRYVNKPAAELLGISVGWRDRNQAGILTAEKDGQIAELVRESMSKGYRLAGRVERVGKNPHYSGEVVADAIKDSRNKRVAGGLIRIQDRNYLHKYLKVAQEVAESSDTSSAMRNMLEAAKELGHKWGRLYVVKKEEESPVFVSKMSFGYEENSEFARAFNGGGVRLSTLEAHPNDWLCIEEKRPVVFCWLKTGADGVPPADGVEYVTPHGLRAINWVSPRQPEAVSKRPGDFWIDFPLITPEAIIGKMCLQCDRSMRPEDFELLKQLAENFSGQLEAFHQRDLRSDAREQTIRVAVAERIMATMAHNIGTRMMGLPIVLENYKDFEGQLPEMVKLNKTFTQTLKRVFTTVERAKEMLLPDIKSLSRANIAEEIERTLSLTLPQRAWSVICVQHPQEVNLDSHLFETALLELVQNSRDAAPNRSRMMISISIDPIWTPTYDSVTITYRDNGPGVPEQLRERIFDDFFSRRPGRKTGTGLGLGFARRVIEAHGGLINYNHTLEPGAAFIITLPRAKANA